MTLSTLRINTNCNRLLFLSYSNELHALGGYELAKSLRKDTVRITAVPKSSHSIHSMFMNHKAQCEVIGQARPENRKHVKNQKIRIWYGWNRMVIRQETRDEIRHVTWG